MRGLKLMAVLTRPDEKSLAADGTLARSAAEGAETYVVLASLGDRDRRAVRDAVGRAGVRDTFLLMFPGERLGEADPGMLMLRLVEHIRLLRPEILVTDAAHAGRWDPDRTIVAELAEAAVAAAADPAYRVPSGREAHQVWIVDAPALPPTTRALVA